MKFQIDREELNRGLGRIQAIVERRGTLPILANALLRADEGGVTVSATDLEVGVVARLEAEVSTPGEVTLGAKKIYEIARELEDPEVRIESADGARVKLESGNASFSLLSISPEEYPSIPTGEGLAFVEIDAAILGELIDRTLYATSTDETRYNLNGVYFENAEEGRLRCVSTDGHRLALVTRSSDKGSDFLKRGIIVPRKGVSEIRKLCEEADGAVEIGLTDDNFLLVRRPDLLLSARLIDGEFVNYRQVIPKDASIRIVIERERFLHAVRRMSLLAHERARGFRFVLDDGKIVLQVSNPDLGEAREELAVDYRGDAFETSFNARYLIDALQSMTSKEISLELLEEVAPAQVKPADDPDQIAIVMPMRL